MSVTETTHFPSLSSRPSPDPAPDLLRVTGVGKSFGGVQANADVSFGLRAGELLALIGPNGAGKSTLFNIINGQLRPDSGSINLGGRDITGLSPRAIWRLGVGRTFQVAQPFLSMTAVENVQTALMSRDRRLFDVFSSAARHRRAEALSLLERVHLADQADRPCNAMAYGDVKRLELAVALAHRPRLLLMDEPTAGMAPGERNELMALTRDLVRRLGRSSIEQDRPIDENSLQSENREQSARPVGSADAPGTAVLFTEHSMDVVFGYADRIIVLARGRVIADGPPQAIRDDPKVAEVYLGTGAAYGRRKA